MRKQRPTRFSVPLWILLVLLVGAPFAARADSVLSDLVNDYDSLSNLRSYAEIDQTTDQYWAEDFKRPASPHLDSNRRLDGNPARTGDDYIVVYGDITQPGFHYALGSALTVAAIAPQVRVFAKPLPQDGYSQNMATCFQNLTRLHPPAAAAVANFLAAQVRVYGRVDTGEAFDLMAFEIGQRQPHPVSDDGCAPEDTETVHRDTDEAIDFGLDASTPYIINGLRVNGVQTPRGVLALLRYGRIRLGDARAERGPYPGGSGTPSAQ